MMLHIKEFISNKVKLSDNKLIIVSNTGWLVFDKIVRMAINFFVSVAIARYLGPEQFGFYNYVLAFVALFSAFAALGLDGVVVRNLVKDSASKYEIVGTAFMLKIAGGLTACCLAALVISIYRAEDLTVRLLVLIASSGFVFQSFDVIDQWFQSQTSSKFPVCAKGAAFLIGSTLKIWLLYIHAPLIAFISVGLAETILGAVGLIILSGLKGISPSRWTRSIRRARELLHDSLPLIFSGIVSMIYLRIDQIMLGDMVGEKALGVYSVAVRLAEVWYFLPMVIMPSLFPSIVKSKAAGDDVFYPRVQKCYNLMVLLGYAVAIPMTFLSNWLVTKLYGPSYAAAGPMLSILVWAGVFVNLGVARSSYLMANNWTKLHFFTVFIGCIVNVVLNLVLIPHIGAMGAVIASCVAYWFAAYGTCFLYPSLFRTGSMMTRALLYPRIW